MSICLKKFIDETEKKSSTLSTKAKPKTFGSFTFLHLKLHWTKIIAQIEDCENNENNELEKR